MRILDNLLNRITMYRLVLYYLYALIAIAAIFGAIGWLPYNPLAILVSFGILTAACWLANAALAKLFRVPANVESNYITAAILTLIISPISFSVTGTALSPNFATGLGFLLAAAIFAMASKYILAINRKHVFNPAAMAVVLTGFILGQYASWWVGGNLPLLAFVIIGGLLLVRKIQRFDLVLSFAAAAVASILLSGFSANLAFDPISTAEKALIHTSLFFFAFVMITEPLTTPPTRPLRIAYGILVGALFSPAIHFGPFYSTPELALVVGNLFSYAVSPKRKYMLTLQSKTEIARDTYDFAFAMDKKISFAPGQYMEFTIQPNGADLRGNRRYFTIASSPTESELHLGIKFYGKATGAARGAGGRSSTFKQQLLALEPGDRIIAGSLAGDFTLPRDSGRHEAPPRKLAFLAGGIGITPFRSMIKYLSDRSERRDIVLFYSNRNADERAYTDSFEEARKTIGLRTIYRDTDHDGRLDAATIRHEIPDWAERTFYLSGPRGMVVAFETALRELGVPRTHVKTDFFPGFA